MECAELYERNKKGDKAIIWITGAEGGVYALADIENDPKPLGILEDHEQWNENDEIGRKHKNEDKTVLKVRIKFLQSLRD